FHYMPGGRELEADPSGVAVLESVLEERDIPYVTAKAWSTDGLYRETPARVARRRDEGCAVVEMEASAFIAVARHRNVKMAHLLYAGDSLAGDEWDHRGWHQASVRRDLFEAAAAAVLRL
ncbi:MAG: purine-nucleoside phosphorylase, partial [Acidimicrobiia bacterium]